MSVDAVLLVGCASGVLVMCSGGTLCTHATSLAVRPNGYSAEPTTRSDSPSRHPRGGLYPDRRPSADGEAER
jgi:hypothetical protein